MQKTGLKKSLALLLCIMLIAAAALFTTGCSDNKQNNTAETETLLQSKEADGTSSEDTKVLGEGQTQFTFIVADADGNETTFEIHTDQTVVGKALLELGLIAGDDSEYGLFVKTVNDITVDYDKDGKYWAFYIDGEYATAGVESTEIAENTVYSFRVE